MKFKYDNLSKEELEQKLIQLRVESEESKIKTDLEIEAIRKESEAIRKETDIIKKETETIRKETEDIRKETEAIRKETEAIKKQGEEEHLKRLAEIDIIKKESEAIRKETDDIKKESEAIRKETDDIRKETEAIRKESEAIRKDTEANINGLSSKYKNLGNNIGQTFEEGMINGLMKCEYFLKNKFDKAFPRMVAKNKENKPVMEVDMVFVNTTTLAIVEIKHGVTMEDVDDIIQNRIPNFRKYFNNFNNFDIIVYLGGGSISKNVIEKAEKLGIGILRPCNEIFIHEVEAKILDKRK